MNKLATFAFTAALAAALTLFGCKEEKAKTPEAGADIVPQAEESALKDSRDGKIYKTVKIGEQVWMAENLNFEAEDSECMDCDKYGRLYKWEAAMKACPAGWHLPTNAEWDILLRYVDGVTNSGNAENPYTSETAGKYLKATSGWDDCGNKSGNGEDKFGFAALPGGGVGFDGAPGPGVEGYWWSASKYTAYEPDYESISWCNDMMSNGRMLDVISFSVRCLQGEAKSTEETSSVTMNCIKYRLRGSSFALTMLLCFDDDSMDGWVLYDGQTERMTITYDRNETRGSGEVTNEVFYYNEIYNGKINGSYVLTYYEGEVVEVRYIRKSDKKEFELEITESNRMTKEAAAAEAGGNSAAYKSVKIGEQVWMAENLNIDVPGSKCYDNKSENCAKYGRLYDWETAMKVCPAGWHLPSNAEWDKLSRFADGNTDNKSPYDSETAGRYLKARSGWNDNGNGEDKFGFAALPGGEGNSSGGFFSSGESGYWWSATEEDVAQAYRRGMLHKHDDALWIFVSKAGLRSVRCAQD